MGVEKKRIISGCGKPEGFLEDWVAHLRWNNGGEAGHNQHRDQRSREAYPQWDQQSREASWPRDQQSSEARRHRDQQSRKEELPNPLMGPALWVTGGSSPTPDGPCSVCDRVRSPNPPDGPCSVHDREWSCNLPIDTALSVTGGSAPTPQLEHDWGRHRNLLIRPALCMTGGSAPTPQSALL
ncbi:hypothetical protein MDA_GLEAN10003409 [Myotis davidii]|uniref:Uncharacterized protein n=1 Tax=Myotis davidii TaxID=225400 RepID=L5LTY8_MYODS|nr:hypothetical protein MDA_GLEAN10003409 [Myotis davidii]